MDDFSAQILFGTDQGASDRREYGRWSMYLILHPTVVRRLWSIHGFREKNQHCKDLDRHEVPINRFQINTIPLAAPPLGQGGRVRLSFSVDDGSSERLVEGVSRFYLSIVCSRSRIKCWLYRLPV